MKEFRFAMQTVVATEAKGYGFAVAVWTTGAFLLAAEDHVSSVTEEMSLDTSD